MMGEAGDFMSLRDPPRSPVPQWRPELFLSVWPNWPWNGHDDLTCLLMLGAAAAADIPVRQPPPPPPPVGKAPIGKAPLGKYPTPPPVVTKG